MVLNVSTNLPGGMTNADYNRLVSTKVEFIKVTELPTSYIQEYPYLYILEKDNSKGEIYEYRSSTGWHQYGGDGAIIPITQADYDKLSTEDKNNGIFYLITDKLLYKGDITVMEGSTTSANGRVGLVPAPASGDTNRSLRADGTWKLPDSELSTTSTNSIQTKVVKAELDKKAPLASPALTGTPTAPTAGAGTNTTQIATTAFVTTAVSNGVAPKAPSASPTFTGTPKAPTAAAGTNTTQIATTAFVQTAVSNGIAASDAMIIKGTIGTNGTVTALPTTYKTGWTYRVVTAGTYAGQVCEIGDLVVALVDRSGSGNVNADWCVAQTNINGAITGIKSGDAYIGVSQSGSVVTITHKDVTRTNTKSTTDPSNGGTFTAVKSVTSDAKGHVTGVDTETVTLPTYSALKNPNAISINGKSYDGSAKVDVGTIGAAYGGTGQTSLNASANALINSLSTGDATPQDADYYVSQYAGGGTSTTTYHRRPLSALWSYVQSKISSVLGLTKTAFGGNSATASKLATARTISLTGSVTGSGSFDGSGNLSIATTTNHTHNYAGSSSAGGAANSLTYFQNTSNTNMGQDTCNSNAIGYVSDYSGTVFTSNVKDGALYRQVYSTSWAHEIYGDYRTGQIAVRGKNNGTWQAWRRVLDESNYTAFTVTKTGSGASGSWGISVTGSSASCTGNAATATKLATARTIALTGSVTGSGTFNGSGNLSITTTTNHTHNYAGSASAGGDATRAIAVADYGDTTKTIKIGFSGAGATTDNLGYIAGYLTGGTQIKDVGKDVLKSWLGLGSAAYTASSNYAAASHSHTKSQITDFPSSLPANGGNADKVDGFHASQSAGSKSACVVTDANGYVNLNYINSNTSNGENPSISQVIVTNGNDNYYRKASLSHLKSSLGSMPASDVYAWAKASAKPSYSWSEITSKPSTFTPASHTHSYAGSSSAGGSATSAVKLDTATAGSATQPVYFTGGKPAACTYTLGKSVPSNAVFTDTWRGIQNNLTSDSTSDSLSAAQGKALANGSARDNTKLPLSGGTMTGALVVNSTIFGCNYTNNRNAPAFIFDKPGSNITGIGANGVNDTIFFGAVNANREWVPSYKQKWEFNGDVTADNVKLKGGSVTLSYNSSTESLDFVFA